MNDLYLYRPRTDTNSKLWNKLRVDRDVVPVKHAEIGWCFTHHRIPEDGIDLCGDEWRDIGPCDFGKALIVRAEIGGSDEVQD